MSDKFYQVCHRGRGVGYFREKSNAERYTQEFHTNIEGYAYPVEIKELVFLDNTIEDKEPEDTFNWGAWGDEHDTTSENGGV